MTENWEIKTQELFDSATLGLIYTLAVLFLVVSIVGIVRLLRGLHIFLTQKAAPNLLFVVVLFIFMFQFGV